MSAGGFELYWNALFGTEPEPALVELRYRLPDRAGMGQEFYGVREPGVARRRVATLAERTDVYIGVAPRIERRGGRDAIEHVHVLYVDVDTPAGVDALRAFRPLPAIVIRSGTPGHVQAYWPLSEPLRPDHAERANRRLAHGLGADMRATDAARILRPPGSLNHKSGRPRAVEIVHLAAEVFAAREVVGELADPPSVGSPATSPARGSDDDVLLTIEPAVYVRALIGAEPGRDGKVRCPFHDDHTPSLHVYADAERGWTCFGCNRGGTIYDFGAALWGLEPRGEGFRELRRRLAAELLGTEAAA